ncbi:hypothetical protein ACKWTF_012487 [Chironomus riparius]
MLLGKNKTTSVKILESQLYENCMESNANVINCVYDNIDTEVFSNTNHFTHCCRLAPSKECRDTCESNLNGSENLTQTEILEIVEDKCGMIQVTMDFWKCFLNNKPQSNRNDIGSDVSRIKNVGIDSTKLHCCIEKAKSTHCQRSCFNVYSYAENYSLPITFQKECLQNNDEINLKQCIEEIDYPVEIGCNGLSFCKNFNNRPTELFRNCNPISDLTARNEYEQWILKKTLNVFDFNLPIIQSKTCIPLLQTVSCILHLKPSTRSLHYNQICWEDCLEFLGKCLDLKQNMLVTSICSSLSPNRNVPCVSIKQYLSPNEDFSRETDLIISPCRNHQCNVTTEICEIDRNTNNYYCEQGGCQIGDGSNYIIPSKSYVRIPSSLKKGCYKICKCNDGNIEKCQVIPCVSPKSCQIGNQTIQHGASLSIECNKCTCYAEEITCTKKQCRLQGITDARSFSTLPCNCPPHYVPVCGVNGKTYASECLAKCIGMKETEFEFGTCESRDPCKQNNCLPKSTCFPNRQVCLSSLRHACPQYKCVTVNSNNCEQELLTDTTFKIHSSACSLIKAKKQLAYAGVFDSKVCRRSGTVCGINGVTYKSECEAMSDYSMIDYYGYCRTVGTIDKRPACENVSCPKNIPHYCGEGLVPTGACCPVCGGIVKIIYSKKQIDRGIYAMNNTHFEMITLKSVLKSLQKLIKVPSCYLSGFLTIETDIMIVVYNIVKDPTLIEIEVCREEAVKITNLINTRSHHVVSNLGLSAIITANYIEPVPASSTRQTNISCYIVISISLNFILYILDISKRNIL